MTIFQQDLEAWFCADTGADDGDQELSRAAMAMGTAMLKYMPYSEDREYALRRLRETYMYACLSRRSLTVDSASLKMPPTHSSPDGQ